MWYIYTNGILLSHKKEQNNAICNNIDATRDYHTQWSKSDKERQVLYDINKKSKKKIQMNLFIKQKQTHRHRKQPYGYQRGKGKERDKLGVWD